MVVSADSARPGTLGVFTGGGGTKVKTSIDKLVIGAGVNFCYMQRTLLGSKLMNELWRLIKLDILLVFPRSAVYGERNVSRKNAKIFFRQTFFAKMIIAKNSIKKRNFAKEKCHEKYFRNNHRYWRWILSFQFWFFLRNFRISYFAVFSRIFVKQAKKFSKSNEIRKNVKMFAKRLYFFVANPVLFVLLRSYMFESKEKI